MSKNKDIDLIITQGQFMKNKARALKKAKEQKIKELLVRTITVSVAVILLVILIGVNNKLTSKGLNGCLENGYSYDYCINHN